MAFEALIARYGLAAIFVGAGIEGEAVAFTGGILAHGGMLSVWQVAIAAAAGAWAADQLWFWLARHFRHARWVEKAKAKPAFERALAILDHHLFLFTLGFRFVYGMRTVTPIALSASAISTRSFVLLNLVSAAVWGPVMVGLGYGFGRVLAPWLAGFHATALAGGGIAAAAAAIVLGLWAIRRHRAPRQALK